ncbi:RCD1 [Enterospora canceri]|uniref:RCD1 n=1 Tax=Enterospora canceri TaxID=1081671 RepID=A0A1Y1S8Y3_9MICR|nr:RCD1 [Enterospora canceri]
MKSKENFTAADFEIEKIEPNTLNLLTHLVTSVMQNESAASELYEFLQCKKETAKESIREIYVFVWFYPGFQLSLLNSICSAYTTNTPSSLESILKLVTLLCEEYVVVRNILQHKLDTSLHPFLCAASVDFSERIKLSVLEIYCSILKTVTNTHCNLIPFSDILPITLRVINQPETRLKVKGTYLLFLIISVQVATEETHQKYSSRGLEYTVQTVDRFNAVDMVIGPLVMHGVNTRNPLLLKNVFRIYLKLCEKSNVRTKILEDKMPEGMFSKEIYSILKNDYELNELHKKIAKVMK